MEDCPNSDVVFYSGCNFHFVHFCIDFFVCKFWIKIKCIKLPFAPLIGFANFSESAVQFLENQGLESQ